MLMKLNKTELEAFRAAGEPKEEPDYLMEARRLIDVLPPEHSGLLMALLDAFGTLVRYERRWYFHKGYLAAKKETR